MDDLSFVRVHRLKSYIFLSLDDFSSKSVGELFESLLSLGPVVLCVNNDLDVFFAVLVDYETCEILDGIKGLPSLADDCP